MADTPVGTAFVEIRPDLRGFEAELSAALRTAVRNITPPTVGLTKGASAQAALGSATRSTTRALSEQAAVMQVNSTELARFSRGIAATGLSQFGLRGATLAATSSFLAGAAAITALSKAVGLATSFNSQLAVFAATTGATASQMEEVSKAAKALGQDLTLPGVTATSAATAMTELAKAGLSVEDAIEGARGVLELAGAANIDFAQATELAASAINAFQLAGRDAGKVADVLANAANSAQGSIVDVGIAFQQAAAIGHQVGLSFQDVTLFITQLAKAGLTGSDAGTSLRTALIRLINPTTKAQKVFKDLGLQVRDAQGNLRPEFFTNLGKAISGMSAKQRDATLALIGGQDAVRALSILSRTNIKDLIAQRNALDTVGTAAKVNEARMTGLKGASAGLSNTIEGLALSLGQKATPALIGATTSLTAFVTAIAQSPAIGVLGETFHVVADAFRDIATAIQTVAPVLQGVIAGLSGAASAVGPAVILTGVAAYLAIGRAIKIATGSLIPFVQGLIAVRAAETAAAEAGIATAGVTEGLGASMLASATGVGALTLGVAAAVAGLVFLITRESEAERATKALKSATDDLASAMDNAAQAQEALGRSQDALKTDQLAATTARLGVEQAKQDLANTKAAHGTLAYEQAVNRLQVAQDTLRRALAQVKEDQKSLNDETKDARALDQQRIDAANKEGEALRKVAQAAQAAQAFRLGGGADAEAATNETIVLSINDRIAALNKLPGAENRALAARLNAIKQLVGHTKDFDLTSQLVLRAPNLDEGLRRVEENFRVTGNEAGVKFVEGLRLQLNPGAVGKVLGDLPGLFAQLGRQSGDNFGAQIVATINAAMTRVNQLIISGATRLTIQLANQTATLLSNVQRSELGGGSLAAQLAIAKEARARADRELAAADAAAKANHGKSVAANKRQQQALQDVAAAQGDVDRIQGEIASKAKDAADARKKKLDDAAKAQQDADAAFIQALGEAQGPIDLGIAKAQLTKGVQDDIDLQLALQAFLRKEIREANASISDIHQRIATVNQLKQALIQSQVTTKGLLQQQKDDAKQAIIDKRDRRQEALELDIQIAETQKNKAKELKAHQALLKFLEDRIKHTTAGTVERKRLQLAIEQEKAAIKDLKKSNDAKNDALKALEFSFLQTQTGFVANLLGNLLPSASVAGTVGGGQTQATPGILGGGAVTPAGAPTTFGGKAIDSKIGADSQKSSTPGPSHGQISTLIDLARAQLRVLQLATKTTKGKLSHPEATIERSAQHAAMDTLPF